MVSLLQSFTYERWANRRTLTHLRTLPEVPDRALRLVAHLIAGLDVWLTRLRQEDSSGVAIWPTWSLDECGRELAAVESAMADFAGTLDEVDLEDAVGYSNQHGLSYKTSIRDILFHLTCHGAYHRGQVSFVLRESGLDPVNTDYITFVRESAGEPWKP